MNANAIPQPGDVWGDPRHSERQRYITAIYSGNRGPVSWVLYGDEEMGGGMLPIDWWYGWVKSSGAVLIQRKGEQS